MYGTAQADNFLLRASSHDYPQGVAFVAALHGNPVQVGTSFAGTLTTADTNSAFASPHGLIGPLTTTSGQLTAGAHTILFEVADTNDPILDSALFLSSFRTATAVGWIRPSLSRVFREPSRLSRISAPVG